CGGPAFCDQRDVDVAGLGRRFFLVGGFQIETFANALVVNSDRPLGDLEVLVVTRVAAMFQPCLPIIDMGFGIPTPRFIVSGVSARRAVLLRWFGFAHALPL